MKKCPNCEINSIVNDDEELCDICKKQLITKDSCITDNNKERVERELIPLLKKLSDNSIEAFTSKNISYEIFKINYPLLVECKNIDKEHCKKEISVGKSSTYRYYIDSYNIHGKNYHICSQWTENGIESSKAILKNICKLIKQKNS